MRRVTSDADLAVACPLCHAEPGRPCGWKGAVYAGVVHRERKRAAAEMPPTVDEIVTEIHTALGLLAWIWFGIPDWGSDGV